MTRDKLERLAEQNFSDYKRIVYRMSRLASKAKRSNRWIRWKAGEHQKQRKLQRQLDYNRLSNQARWLWIRQERFWDTLEIVASDNSDPLLTFVSTASDY